MQRPSQQFILLASATIAVFIIFEVYAIKKELQDVQASVPDLVKHFASQKWESQLSHSLPFISL